jgi:anti-sigma factor RsiW
LFTRLWGTFTARISSGGRELTMKRIISPRDVQLLSEFMDGQLPEAKKARLEARLKSDQELQAALEELRQTRALLRSLPRMQAPRNFSLTPQMVGRKTEPARPLRRWMPVFQFSGVLASLLLVLVLAGDLLGVVPSASPASQSADQAFRVMQAPEDKALESTNQAQNGEAGGATPTDGAVLEMASPKSASPVTPTITNTAPISSTMTISPGLAAPVAREIPTAEAAASSPGKALAVQAPGKEAWRLAEITLTGIALVSLFAIFYLRRRSAG